MMDWTAPSIPLEKRNFLYLEFELLDKIMTFNFLCNEALYFLIFTLKPKLSSLNLFYRNAFG